MGLLAADISEEVRTFGQSFRSPMLLPNLRGKSLILASKSPRRQELLKGLEVHFEIRTREIDESWPSEMDRSKVAEFVAGKKADAFADELEPNDVLITSDTTVYLEGDILEKPVDRADALRMLTALNGKTHTVYTGVCIQGQGRRVSFTDATHVTFAELTPEELSHYVDVYKPYDKAGAYGAQEFMGYVGIEKLEGSYFNVMGLPLHRLYQELKSF